MFNPLVLRGKGLR